MDALTARTELEEAHAYLAAAEAALGRACSAMTGIPGDAATHVRFDLQHAAKKLTNILRLVRLQPAPVRVDLVTTTTAPPAPTTDPRGN